MKSVPKVQSRETANDVAAYRAAADAADMHSIRLIFSQFDLKPEGLDSDKGNWSQGYSCVTQATSFNEEKNMLHAFVEAEAFCKSGKKKIISLRCKYIVSYSVQGEPDPAAANRFAHHVGRFAAYPYFRAHFAEVTSQAGLYLPPLPVMREGKRIIGKSTDEPVGMP